MGGTSVASELVVAADGSEVVSRYPCSSSVMLYQRAMDWAHLGIHRFNGFLLSTSESIPWTARDLRRVPDVASA